MAVLARGRFLLQWHMSVWIVFQRIPYAPQHRFGLVSCDCTDHVDSQCGAVPWQQIFVQHCSSRWPRDCVTLKSLRATVIISLLRLEGNQRTHIRETRTLFCNAPATMPARQSKQPCPCDQCGGRPATYATRKAHERAFRLSLIANASEPSSPERDELPESSSAVHATTIASFAARVESFLTDPPAALTFLHCPSLVPTLGGGAAQDRYLLERGASDNVNFLQLEAEGISLEAQGGEVVADCLRRLGQWKVSIWNEQLKRGQPASFPIYLCLTSQ